MLREPEALAAVSPVVAGLLSLGAIVAACAEALLRRWHRQSIWISEPERLLNNPPAANWAATVGGILGIAAAIAWLPIAQQSAWSPVGLALAGLAILGWGHFLASPGIGFAGLLAVGSAVALVPAAWFGATTIGPLVGWILAAGWMLWLAKFWDQQLDAGRAWTTTGAVIPMARGAALVFAAMLLQSSVRFWVPGDPELGIAGRMTLILLEFGLLVVFWRNARRQRSVSTTIGIWMVAAAIFLAAVSGKSDLAFHVSWWNILVLAPLTNPPLRTPLGTTLVHLAMARFVLPSLVATLLILGPLSVSSLVAIMLVLVGVILSFRLQCTTQTHEVQGLPRG